MKINWNDRVAVTPNEYGWEIWTKYYTDLGITPPGRDMESNLYSIKMELWSVALIWGRHLYNGCASPFKSMDMEYLED